MDGRHGACDTASALWWAPPRLQGRLDIDRTSRGAAAGIAIRGVLVTAATARGGRDRNEDAIGIDGWAVLSDDRSSLETSLRVVEGRWVVVAVADGLGGRPAGDRAARIAVQHLTAPDLLQTSPAGALAAAFRRSDAAIRAATDDRSRGMGCTAAVVAIGHDGWSAAANVGDVRIYHVVDGYPGQLTVDDRPPAVSGRPAGHLVTGWLGGGRRPAVAPHVREFSVLPADRLILCSDGLHDAVAGTVLRRFAGADARQAVEGLMQAALEGDAGDNVTLVLLDIV